MNIIIIDPLSLQPILVSPSAPSKKIIKPKKN